MQTTRRTLPGWAYTVLALVFLVAFTIALRAWVPGILHECDEPNFDCYPSQ